MSLVLLLAAAAATAIESDNYLVGEFSECSLIFLIIGVTPNI